MKKNKLTVLKIDRQAFSVTASFDDSDVKRHWLARTPRERIQHIEVLRRINYGNLATQRMKRVLEIVEQLTPSDKSDGYCAGKPASRVS